MLCKKKVAKNENVVKNVSIITSIMPFFLTVKNKCDKINNNVTLYRTSTDEYHERLLRYSSRSI